MFNVKLITPSGETYEFKVGRDEYILEEALKVYPGLPYSCLQGWCLTCAVKILSGQIDQKDSRRYYESDREEGFGLICTGKPLSDLVLRTDASDEMKAAREKKGLPFPRGSWGR
ncbi:MAG: 2Fe-2S iron-sulfur cluster-binding protein [Syntrophothermus sp.]